MSASRSSAESFVDRSQFLDIYPVCSRLIAEIGREFIRSWSVEQAQGLRESFVRQLVDEGGVSIAKAEMAWRLVVQDHGKSDSVAEKNETLQRVDGGSSRALPATSSKVVVSQVQFSKPAPADGNVFSFEDGRWVVRFLGKTIYPQDINGIKYLHYLISHPGRVFSPRELYDGFSTRKSGNRLKSMSAGEALRSGVAFDSARPDVAVDQQGKSEMLSRLEDIESEMAAAKLVPDADLIEKLAAERIGITEYLRKAFTPVGSRRIQEPDLVRRMKAVDIAIRRAKEKIQRAGHHDLLAHLNESIEVKVKSGCRYSAGPGNDWRTTAVQFDAPSNPR